MDIQTAIDGLEKELEEIGKETGALLDILCTISETLPDVPSCHKEWSSHPATKYLADKFSENRKKSTQLCKAIKELKAIIK
jgi:hypothetical protein